VDLAVRPAGRPACGPLPELGALVP
jgi:hypothetical protein